MLDDEELRAQIARMQASLLFAGAPQLQRMFKLFVASALGDYPRRLNPYAIATLALNRSDDFNPNDNSIVRVELKRFRSALARYLVEVEPDAPFNIELPIRQYQLRITRREAAGGVVHELSSARRYTGVSAGKAPRPPLRPRLIITCDFEPARGLVQQFVRLASRFDFYLLFLGDVSLDDLEREHLDMTVRFSRCAIHEAAASITVIAHNGAVIADVNTTLDPSSGEDQYPAFLELKPLRSVVQNLFAEGGIIQAHIVNSRDWENTGAVSICALYRYFCSYDRSIMEFYTRRINEFPEHLKADGYFAMLRTYVALDRYWRAGPGSENALEDALAWSYRATEKLPGSASASYARSLVEHFRGNTAEALRLGRLAHSQNPLDCAAAAGLAARYLYLGEFDRARELLYSAYAGVNFRPVWVTFVMAVLAIVTKSTCELEKLALEITEDDFQIGLAVKMMAAHMLSNHVMLHNAARVFETKTGREIGFVCEIVDRYFGRSSLGPEMSALAQAMFDTLTIAPALEVRA